MRNPIFSQYQTLYNPQTQAPLPTFNHNFNNNLPKHTAMKINQLQHQNQPKEVITRKNIIEPSEESKKIANYSNFIEKLSKNLFSEEVDTIYKDLSKENQVFTE